MSIIEQNYSCPEEEEEIEYNLRPSSQEYISMINSCTDYEQAIKVRNMLRKH